MQDSTSRWKNANQVNLHKSSSTPEKATEVFRSPRQPPATPLELAEADDGDDDVALTTKRNVPLDPTIRTMEVQLDILKAKCDAQSLGVFRLEQQMEALKVSSHESVDVEDTTREEEASLEEHIVELEKQLENISGSDENVNPVGVPINHQIEHSKMELRLKLADLVEKQESQSTAVLELSNILASRKDALKCFRQFREEQRLAIKALEDERDEHDREAWNSDLPTPVNETKTDYTDKKIQLLRDQLSRTENSYLEQEGMFTTRVSTEREKLHEIKDQLQLLRDAHDGINSKHAKFHESLKRTPRKSPRKTVFMGLSPFRNRLGSSDSQNTSSNRERAASQSSVTSISDPASSGEKENSRFTFFQPIQSNSARFALSDTLKAWTRPRTPKAHNLKPRRGARVMTGIVLQREAELSWIPRHAILYKCEECFQLRLSDSSKLTSPDIFNLVLGESSIEEMTEEYPEQPYWFSIKAPQYNVGTVTVILAFESDEECDSWYSCLHEATTAPSNTNVLEIQESESLEES